MTDQNSPSHGNIKPFVLTSRDRGGELTLLPRAGGIVSSLVLSDANGRVDIVAGLDATQASAGNPAYRGVPLFPFPNRLDGGVYRFGGHEYRFDVNEPAQNNALHGFLYRLEPDIVETPHEGDSASVALLYRYDGDLAAYPFASSVRMTYTLEGRDGLRVEFAVINQSQQEMPAGFGWHPYYRLHRPVDELQLQLPDCQRLLLDNRQLPTGERCREERFGSLETLGATNLDDCFDLGRPEGASRVVLWSPKDERGLEFWQDADLGYVQLYTPPDRQSIAVEPMSCEPNAFNTGRGLWTLQPGQTVSGAFGVRLIDKPKR